MPRKTLPRLLNLILRKSSLALVATVGFWQVPMSVHAAVTAGGIAILGYTDDYDLNDEGTFSIATLEAISAGTTIYFSDNGWKDDDTFRGASLTDGNGNETLIKLTFNSNVVAGTILKSGVNTGAATWNTSGLIEGTGQSYSLLNLVSDGSGDQIYAFEADNFPPLFHPSNHIFLLDFGDNLNPGFETASSSSTGDAPSELTIGNTAVTLPDPAFGDDDNDFHNGSFALNMADPDVVALNTSVTPVTKAQWLAVIANSDNWLQYNYVGSDVDAESQLGALNFAGVPEPSRALLLALGGCIAGIRRRRKTA